MKRFKIKEFCVSLWVFGFALLVQGSPFDSWMFRSKIQFTGYTGSATLTDFPALVKLDGDTIADFRYSDFLSGDNADLRFSAADGVTELDYEIEHWDPDGTSYVWVRVPEIVDTDTFVYVYWGRGGQVAPPSTTNGAVWGETHLGVLHLNDGVQDATSRDNHGVNHATTTANGIIAGGRSFDGSTSIELPANLRNLGATNSFAISFWFKSASASSSLQCLMEDGTSWTGDAIYLFANAGANQIAAHLRNDSGSAVQLDTISVPPVGTDWHFLAHVFDGAVVRTYFDGSEVWSANISGNINSGNTPLQIGRRPPGSNYFQGVMDEVRIEKVSRPVDWIRACWMNQGANATFQTYGAAELQSGVPEIENRMPVVLDANTAVLNGYMVSTGTAPATVSAYWGPSDGGEPDSGLWQSTNTWAAGTWENGDTPALTVSNLTAGTFYYYRYAAGNQYGDSWAPESTYFLAGDVWVTGGTAYEEGEIPADFTFYRPATATGETTVVYFTIGGTASPGDDYVAITQESVTIPVGATNATLTVYPIFDLFDEPDETVELTLLPGLYALGTPSQAVVTIVDADVPAETNWSVISASSNWHDSASWSLGRVPITGEDVIVTNDLLLDEPTVLLNSFTLQGGTVTFTNWTTRLRAVEVDLQAGTLTHAPQSAQSAGAAGKWLPDARVWIACSNLTLSASATIQADSRGYAREKGPGIVSGTYGGSYGGRGTGESGWVNRPGTYGSVSEPTEPGSGGWSMVSTGGRDNTGAGGGAIRIDASGRVDIHGALTANGGHGTVVHASGGSGGAIFITCDTFAGSDTGLLSVRAGNGNNRGGPAGGGRIALVYNPASQAQMTPVTPAVRFNAAQGVGGSRPETAEPGTIYFPYPTLLSAQMTAQWLGGDLHIPDFEVWSLPGSLDVAGVFGLPTVTNLLVGGDLAIQPGGRLSLYSAPTNAVSPPYGMELKVGGELSIANNGRLILASNPTNGAIPWVTCDRLLVAEGGIIDANFKGFAPHGESYYTGPGGGTQGTYGEGASHGGRGSTGIGNWTRTTQPYGDPLWPVMPGSAGGSTAVGGHGGGVIAIVCNDTATIQGTLTANGYMSGSHGGTGSGGSILIGCKTFHGSATGLLRARGGSPVMNSGGGGAGGRIAVVYDPVAQTALAQPNPGVGFDTTPGPGVNPHLAERGTLYLPDAQNLFLSAHMTVQWQDVDLIIPEGLPHWALPSLQVDGKFNLPGLETMAVAGDVTVTSGGRLSLYSHPSNTVSAEIGFRLDAVGTLTVQNGGEIMLLADLDTGAVPYLECNNFDLQAGGLVIADFRGFDMARGEGRGIYRAGGGYGGAGSRGADGAANAGQPYARAHAPIYAGSGAGDYASGGGRGGGAVRIGARNAMTVDGTIRANGMARLSTHAGSGSGGGILLSARTFAGGGTMQADGAISSHAGGAGGGGRIAVWTPFLPPEYLRTLVDRDLPTSAEEQDHETLWPGLTLSVAAATGGTNPEEAEDGTIFFGRLSLATLLMLR